MDIVYICAYGIYVNDMRDVIQTCSIHISASFMEKKGNKTKKNVREPPKINKLLLRPFTGC